MLAFESEWREISQGIFPTLFNSSSNQMFWGGKRETMWTVIKSSKLVSCIHIAFKSRSVGWWQWNRVTQIVIKCSPIGPPVIFTSAIEIFGSETTVPGCRRGALLLRHLSLTDYMWTAYEFWSVKSFISLLTVRQCVLMHLFNGWVLFNLIEISRC